MARRARRIGLALGSGAARGWAHIGIIRALEEAGVKPEVVCGTSIGALVGAAYASGELDRLEQWVRGLAWTGVLRLLDVTWGGGGLIRGRRLFDFLRAQFEDKEIGELPITYGAVATELGTGREIWLREGKVLDAVRASVAMPGLFSPVSRDGELLVDGGLVNPVPVSMCRVLGAEIVIAVDLGWSKLVTARSRAQDGSDGRRKRPTPSIIEVFQASLDVVEMRVARSRLAGDPADLLLTPLLPGFAVLDYHRAAEAIAEGRAAVERMRPMLEHVLSI